MPKGKGFAVAKPDRLSEEQRAFARAWSVEDGMSSKDKDEFRAALARVCAAAGVEEKRGLSLRNSYMVMQEVVRLKDKLIRQHRIPWRSLLEKSKQTLLEAQEAAPWSARVTAAKTALDVGVKTDAIRATLDEVEGAASSTDEAALRLVGNDE